MMGDRCISQLKSLAIAPLQKLLRVQMAEQLR